MNEYHDLIKTLLQARCTDALALFEKLKEAESEKKELKDKMAENETEKKQLRDKMAENEKLVQTLLSEKGTALSSAIMAPTTSPM